MGEKKDKGRPVNLSDLLKITPVANEILRLSGEMSYSPTDLLWIVGEMMDGSEDIAGQEAVAEELEIHEFRRRPKLYFESLEIDEDEDEDEEELWDASELDDLGVDELTALSGEDDTIYSVAIKIQGCGSFPAMGFKADIKQKDDLKKFIDMVMEMVERFEA
ncbi:MAG: hypothetical protein ACM3O9_03955 [Methylocystaceae bacterium]